ncbi:MAG: hypothetical protein VXZ73_04150 [Pseudomonadota bacterium]|nr:hypothetical protein [Pseudomonadota bacterium]MEC8977410.1 hypothetical protein [Pseudomonadota bacterium]
MFKGMLDCLSNAKKDGQELLADMDFLRRNFNTSCRVVYKEEALDLIQRIGLLSVFFLLTKNSIMVTVNKLLNSTTQETAYCPDPRQLRPETNWMPDTLNHMGREGLKDMQCQDYEGFNLDSVDAHSLQWDAKSYILGFTLFLRPSLCFVQNAFKIVRQLRIMHSPATVANRLEEVSGMNGNVVVDVDGEPSSEDTPVLAKEIIHAQSREIDEMRLVERTGEEPANNNGTMVNDSLQMI